MGCWKNVKEGGGGEVKSSPSWSKFQVAVRSLNSRFLITQLGFFYIVAPLCITLLICEKGWVQCSSFYISTSHSTCMSLNWWWWTPSRLSWKSNLQVYLTLVLFCSMVVIILAVSLSDFSMGGFLTILIVLHVVIWVLLIFLWLMSHMLFALVNWFIAQSNSISILVLN